MAKTKTIVLGGQSFIVGPFVIGQVEIIAPVIWRFMKALGDKDKIINSDPMTLFLSLEISPELVRDMTTAIAAAMPKNEAGKRPSADEVRGMEATFLEMCIAVFSIIPLAGFGATGEEQPLGETPAGAT